MYIYREIVYHAPPTDVERKTRRDEDGCDRSVGIRRAHNAAIEPVRGGGEFRECGCNLTYKHEDFRFCAQTVVLKKRNTSRLCL